MVHATRGIVLRTVKYGETSIVTTLFTEKFGVQTYLVNGVRTTGKPGNKAALYQPAALLNLEVYHNELKNMQRIREANWGLLATNIFSDVIKNSVALFMIELLQRALKQPEENAELFNFVSESLEQLDESSQTVAANFPLFFALNLPYFFGFAFNRQTRDHGFLDLQEGSFVNEQPSHLYFLEGRAAKHTAELLKVMQPGELEQIHLNSTFRNELLDEYIKYFQLHIQDFGDMRTLPVLRQIL
jgi:DNA repair protein RecO (recombination protein O)